MKTVTIKAFVHADKYAAGGYTIYPVDMSNNGMVCVGAVDVQYPIPAHYNPVTAEIAMLEKKLGAMADEYHGKTAQLKSRISDLQCLPAPRFPMTYCSQCGNEQGPGNEGVSSCDDHRTAHLRMTAEENGA